MRGKARDRWRQKGALLQRRMGAVTAFEEDAGPRVPVRRRQKDLLARDSKLQNCLSILRLPRTVDDNAICGRSCIAWRRANLVQKAKIPGNDFAIQRRRPFCKDAGCSVSGVNRHGCALGPDPAQPKFATDLAGFHRHRQATAGRVFSASSDGTLPKRDRCARVTCHSQSAKNGGEYGFLEHVALLCSWCLESKSCCCWQTRPASKRDQSRASLRPP